MFKLSSVFLIIAAFARVQLLAVPVGGGQHQLQGVLRHLPPAQHVQLVVPGHRAARLDVADARHGRGRRERRGRPLHAQLHRRSDVGGREQSRQEAGLSEPGRRAQPDPGAVAAVPGGPDHVRRGRQRRRHGAGRRPVAALLCDGLRRL